MNGEVEIIEPITNDIDELFEIVTDKVINFKKDLAPYLIAARDFYAAPGFRKDLCKNKEICTFKDFCEKAGLRRSTAYWIIEKHQQKLLPVGQRKQKAVTPKVKVSKRSSTPERDDSDDMVREYPYQKPVDIPYETEGLLDDPYEGQRYDDPEDDPHEVEEEEEDISSFDKITNFIIEVLENHTSKEWLEILPQIRKFCGTLENTARSKLSEQEDDEYRFHGLTPIPVDSTDTTDILGYTITDLQPRNGERADREYIDRLSDYQENLPDGFENKNSLGLQEHLEEAYYLCVSRNGGNGNG